MLNLSQYRRVVGAFNSWFIHIKQHNNFKNVFSQSKVKQNIHKEIFKVFTSFLIFVLISSSWSFINLPQIKARLISLSVFRISYICILLAFIHPIWLHLILFNRSGDIEKNLGPNSNSYQSFSICHWNLNNIFRHNLLKLFVSHSLLFTNFMLYVSQRLMLIHPFYKMIIIFNFKVIISVGKIILQLLNEELFVFTTAFLFHMKLKI